MAVIAAGELDHLIPLGVGPHHPQYGHTGFCTRIHEPDHFDAGYGLNHHFGQHIFEVAGGTKAGPFSKAADNAWRTSGWA